MKIWSVFWLVLFLSGCSTQSTQPLSTAEKPMPEWFLNLPMDASGQVLYGAGEGGSRKAAVQAALVDIASQLSIQVASDFETRLNVKESTYTLVDRTTQKQIRSQVSEITIQDYQVLDVEQLAYDKYVALVNVSKKKLFNDLKAQVQQQVSLLTAAEQNQSDSSVLMQYLFYKSSLQSLKPFEQTLKVLKTLNPTVSMQSYHQFLTHYQQRTNQLKSQIQWKIEADHSSQKWAGLIQHALSQQGFQVAPSADSNSTSVIHLTTRLNSSNAYGFHIARVVLNVDILSEGVSIGGNQIHLKGQAVNSLDQALNNAATKLQKQLEQQGLNQVIGLRHL
ncbi:MAG: LPP20 family lipoprotein [Hydrogenovibrio crunogenus]|uniref:Lipoprotein LPP20-like domain-containing protein n=1 Tax=Hydrogenovibrio crunogenus (strain DSM 25203 / XCL-2) TaxID=317025 RepID=Q31E51_HYDCU|nr:LPP20 family lipoprotein [Hydrogenovibrio crunogenus]